MALLDINREAAERVADDLAAANHAVRAHGVDVSDEAAFARIVAVVAEERGSLDVAVNNCWDRGGSCQAGGT